MSGFLDNFISAPHKYAKNHNLVIKCFSGTVINNSVRMIYDTMTCIKLARIIIYKTL